MLELFEDEYYSGETFDAVKVTSEGMRWLLENKEKLTLSVVTNHRKETESLTTMSRFDR